MTARLLSKQTEPKRIFIVDDHPVFREGLVGLIKREGDLTVCGEANDARQAMAAFERAKFDLLLVDISLPGKSGLELIRDIRAVRPNTAVLVISMHDESLYAERVLRAGGRYATMTWDRRELNPWLGLVLDAVSEQFGVPFPPPTVRGPFSLEDADE